MNSSTCDRIDWFENEAARKGAVPGPLMEMFTVEKIRSVRKFHETLPRFQVSPLTSLPRLAAALGVASVRVKDESHRCGLNAFKVLGASHGICRALAGRMDLQSSDLRFEDFTAPAAREKVRDVTLVTATDGNHGRAVAWVAEQVGCKSVVLMPAGSSRVRLNNIRRHGADASIIDGNYDEAVRRAAGMARENDWLLIQDTTAPGGDDSMPVWIMQGYAAMIDEACGQMGERKPSHVFAQCGVGSFAASIQAYLVRKYGDERPVFVAVEPTRAACFFESIRSGFGEPVRIEGEMNTIMAGLACGEPSGLAWPVLRDYADAFVACPDEIAEKGMRMLADPLPGDEAIVSGESGAVTIGLLAEIAGRSKYRALKQSLGIGRSSDILLFSTEGDTDPESYRRITCLAQTDDGPGDEFHRF